MDDSRRGTEILGAFIDAVGWEEALHRLLRWARTRQSRYVTICNVHVVVSVMRDAAYRAAINGADMAVPDGAPVAWMLRRLGFAGQPRVSGPDLTWALCDRCASEKLRVYFYGSTESTLTSLRQKLQLEFPSLVICGLDSPPFRDLSAEEDAAVVARINDSGASIVFVGLGCPKQERWMAAHHGRINAVMIGVGAAFDFLAGNVKRAPKWMREHGLEWLHRLWSEPRRLWRRYLITNSIFLYAASMQLLSRKHR